MRTDTPVANGDPTLAALIPEGVTLAHIVRCSMTAYPETREQLLRARLGATHPATLRPPSWPNSSSTCWMAQAGRDQRPRRRACIYECGSRLKRLPPNSGFGAMADIAAERKSDRACPGHDQEQLIEDLRCIDAAAGGPDNDHRKPLRRARDDGRVFRDRHERNFFIGRLSPRQKEEWLRDHPDRWQTREEFLRDLQARARTDVAAEPTEPRSTPSQARCRLVASPNGLLPVPGEDKPQPHKSATNTAPPTIANPEARLPRRPPLATRSLSTGVDLSASVALLKCSAATRGRCNAGARKGKAPRARR